MMTILANWQALLSGVGITLLLMFASLALGFLLSIALALCQLADNYCLRKLVSLCVFFVRGTPLLVQIFLIYYGLAQFAWLRESPLWLILKSPMACAIIALAINTASYTSVLLLGAIRSVPKNEIDAAEAIGMSKWLTIRRIVLPRALRIMMPAYSNEVAIILKATSLASTITLLDIMGVIQQLISATYNTVTFYCVAAVLYLLINAVLMTVFNLLFKHYALPTRV